MFYTENWRLEGNFEGNNSKKKKKVFGILKNSFIFQKEICIALEKHVNIWNQL